MSPKDVRKSSLCCGVYTSSIRIELWVNSYPWFFIAIRCPQYCLSDAVCLDSPREDSVSKLHPRLYSESSDAQPDPASFRTTVKINSNVFRTPLYGIQTLSQNHPGIPKYMEL